MGICRFFYTDTAALRPPTQESFMENAHAPGCEILTNGTPVFTAPGFTFGTDGLLLARFCRPKPRQRAVDLCSGCGIVSLEWHDGGHRGPCAALELDPAGTALCARSTAALPQGTHITPINGDQRLWRDAAWEGLCDVAACNPPYFTGGYRSPDPARAAARHEDSCSLEDAAAAAFRLLRDGGRFAVVQKPDQLARVCAVLSCARLEPKRLCFVRSAAGKPPVLILVEAQKNRRPGLTIEPDILLDSGAAQYGG